jgi:Domain of unknown function (DUF6378)
MAIIRPVRPGPLTKERRKTHGDWLSTALIAQHLKGALAAEVAMHRPGRPLEPQQREALDMILAKIARIVSGDPNHPDHWQDIAGYAELALGREAA